GVATQATASTGSGGGGASGGGRSALGARSGTVICARRAAGGVAVLLEVLPPFGVNRLRILLILLVHLIDQPFVLTEIRAAHSRSSPLFIMTSVSLYQPTRCAMRFRFQVARHRPAENGVCPSEIPGTRRLNLRSSRRITKAPDDGLVQQFFRR